jgi:hypothetical protein
MADSKDNTGTTTVGMHLPEETADRIREQAEREHRSVSSLLKSIVLPEIERREQDGEKPEAVPA